jgi:hypothetical protein
MTTFDYSLRFFNVYIVQSFDGESAILYNHQQANSVADGFGPNPDPVSQLRPDRIQILLSKI